MQNRGLRVGITAGAVCVVLLHLWKPELQIDAITVVLLIVAALPWVQPLIKSIELLGVKLELQELKTALADAKGAAESASRKAEFLLFSPAPQVGPLSLDAQSADQANEAFVQQMKAYEHIRETQSSGTARTQAMTAVVRKMIELAPRQTKFEIAHALNAEQRGQRLAAYAYLYAMPDFQLLGPLVASVTKLEDKPFGQYWGLQAISRLLAIRKNESVSPDVSRNLSQYAEHVQRGTDRDYEVRRLLHDLELKQLSD